MSRDRTSPAPRRCRYSRIGGAGVQSRVQRVDWIQALSRISTARRGPSAVATAAMAEIAAMVIAVVPMIEIMAPEIVVPVAIVGIEAGRVEPIGRTLVAVGLVLRLRAGGAAGRVPAVVGGS